MRLFLALPLCPEAVERLTRFRLRQSAPRDGLRWSEPEQWHITLQFYGEVDSERALCLRRALLSLQAAVPEMCMRSFGVFAAKGLLFSALESTASLNRLHAAAQLTSSTCGMLPESRPFHPHVTLARSKGKAGFATLGKLTRPELPSFGAPITWRPGQLHLLQSELRPNGAHYSTVASVDLQAAQSSPP